MPGQADGRVDGQSLFNKFLPGNKGSSKNTLYFTFQSNWFDRKTKKKKKKNKSRLMIRENLKTLKKTFLE